MNEPRVVEWAVGTTSSKIHCTIREGLTVCSRPLPKKTSIIKDRGQDLSLLTCQACIRGLRRRQML